MQRSSIAENGTRVLQAAHCSQCKGYSFPASVPGCRHCGAAPEALTTVDCSRPVQLLNVITVHTALAPGIGVPAIIGEIELCPRVVEEVRIEAENEAAVPPGTWLMPVWSEDTDGGSWVFRPVPEKADPHQGDAE
ncbi:hypothetical protein [Cupriavidus oxalaticus]|uniref:DUF35 domain-containing protein n=1 Tax=Cupriavidus oxalaticus TaxID=96344 RepID=A0A375GIF9_9BURK|nr:hypothetical protein [Cupriavidus oxalaticus]QRQ84644.1 hypothetical protein JTE91_00620 [Cupriavidus oxalaticus]QRQ91267.1 hypothetical protein JTE92_11725 [Cupriavidus oxalaticus]WQD85825.1 hypothetical protein U0036_29880 [Cupriavidus oxalaticus]SPC20649.1 conserved hypothetical protein [Cupriavidus oxalaticus]